MFRPDILAGRVALITGGGTGLGRVMAEHFVRYGARCIILGRREEPLVAAAEQLGRESVLPIPCDVRELLQVEAAVEQGWNHFGPIDILVNNAAANLLSPTKDLTPNAFRLVGDVVYLGAVNCSLTLGKRWIAEGRGGTVLNILTAYAATGSGYVVPSACAKAAVATLTRSLAAEWGKYGIRMVAIAPGPFPTEGATSRLFLDDSWKERAIRRIPARRMGLLEEFGNLAVFLASSDSAYINGEIIRIDGGEGVFLAGEFNFLEEVSPEAWRRFRRYARNPEAKGRSSPAEDATATAPQGDLEMHTTTTTTTNNNNTRQLPEE